MVKLHWETESKETMKKRVKQEPNLIRKNEVPQWNGQKQVSGYRELTQRQAMLEMT